MYLPLVLVPPLLLVGVRDVWDPSWRNLHEWRLDILQLIWQPLLYKKGNRNSHVRNNILNPLKSRQPLYTKDKLTGPNMSFIQRFQSLYHYIITITIIMYLLWITHFCHVNVISEYLKLPKLFHESFSGKQLLKLITSSFK